MTFDPPSTPPRKAPSRSGRWTSLSLGSPWSSPTSSASPRQRHGKRRTSDAHDAEAATPSKSLRKPRAGSVAYARGRGPIKAGGKLACRVIIVGLLASVIAWTWTARSIRDKVKIPKRYWKPIPYTHIDSSNPLNLEPGTRLFHVTKEFGPATMGGLGVMLTALASSQVDASDLSVSVIMPHYSYLRETEHDARTRHFAHLHVPITTSRNETKLIGCDISLLRWPVSSKLDFLAIDERLHNDQHESQGYVDIYLIGPGDEAPFNVAFHAKDAGDVYSAYKPLKQEWKDLWFARATAEFVQHLNDYEGFSTSDSDDDGVDVVHLHGATNSMVAYYLEDKKRPTRRPAVVYTLHDSLDEVEYSNLVTNVVTFLPPSAAPLHDLQPYIHEKQVFPSALGIDYADMVTFVSKSIASDIVEGRFRFNLQDLVMPSIVRRAAQGDFVGVSNGLDFGDESRNPWLSDQLKRHGVAFPVVGEHLLAEDTFWLDEARDEVAGRIISSHGREVDLDNVDEDQARTQDAISFVETKERAKQRLVQVLPHLFSTDDLYRPLILFVGRFQYNKGCEFFEPVLELLSSDDVDPALSARLVVMGARNNYPIKALRRLQTRYSNHFTLIDDTTSVQSECGTLVRMAADFAFAPSFSEAFGLVAAEGMLFGMEVVSTGVGGLVEFLRPLPDRSSDAHLRFRDRQGGNARLFQLYDGVGPRQGSGTGGGELSLRADQARPGKKLLEPAFERCRRATEGAIRAWRDRKTWRWMDREMWVRGLIMDALELRWDRDGGPVDEYERVYQRALGHARPNLAAGAEDAGHVGSDRVLQVRDPAPALPIYKKWSSSPSSESRRNVPNAKKENTKGPAKGSAGRHVALGTGQRGAGQQQRKNTNKGGTKGVKQRLR